MTERALDPFVHCEDPGAREVLRKFLPRFLNQIKKANPIGYLTMQNRQIAVFNLDGSVCDDLWRRPLLKEGAELGSQSEYHHKHSFDQPTTDVMKRFDFLRSRGIFFVFYTGRPLSYWDSTKQWLLKHFGFTVMDDYELFMRPTNGDQFGNNRDLSDVELKRYIIRTLKSRPATEIVSVSDCNVDVLRMIREEGLTAKILDCTEGYRDPMKNVEPQDAFRVAAQDFALKANGRMAGLPAAANGFFAVDLSTTQPVPGVAAFEDRNEVQDHWKKTAHATIKAGQEISHDVRLASNFPHEERVRQQALLEMIRREKEERQPLRVVTADKDGDLSEVKATPDYSEAMRLIGMHDYAPASTKALEAWEQSMKVNPETVGGPPIPERTNGVSPEEHDAKYYGGGTMRVPATKMTFPTAQEATKDAVKKFPWADASSGRNEAAQGPEKSIAEAMEAMGIIHKDAESVGSLMEFFFPDGIKMRDATDYQFVSLLQTALYSLNEFVRTGMSDDTKLKQIVMFMSALEPLLRVHTVESLDGEDSEG